MDEKNRKIVELSRLLESGKIDEKTFESEINRIVPDFTGYLDGDGGVAQGNGPTAAGKEGVAVGGNVGGSVNIFRLIFRSKEEVRAEIKPRSLDLFLWIALTICLTIGIISVFPAQAEYHTENVKVSLTSLIVSVILLIVAFTVSLLIKNISRFKIIVLLYIPLSFAISVSSASVILDQDIKKVILVVVESILYSDQQRHGTPHIPEEKDLKQHQNDEHGKDKPEKREPQKRTDNGEKTKDRIPDREIISDKANEEAQERPSTIQSDKTENYTIQWNGKTFSFANSIGMAFVYIPPGEFMIGSPEGSGFDREKPQHKVMISEGFYIQTTEVTQGQWKAVMGENPSYFKDCGDECPVESVSWNNVQKFIKKLNDMEGTDNYRLPTEAEWEYACRAGSESAYCYGDDPGVLSEYAWYSKNFDFKTHPVGQLKPNEWGLYDMHGNVWEWTSSIYKPYPYDSNDGRETINDDGNHSRRVLRGGSYHYSADLVRCAYRYWLNPGNWNWDRGFRVLFSPTSTSGL